MLTHDERDSASNREVEWEDGEVWEEEGEAHHEAWEPPHQDISSPPFLATLFSSGAPEDFSLGEEEDHRTQMGVEDHDGGESRLASPPPPPPTPPPLVWESHPLWNGNTAESQESWDGTQVGIDVKDDHLMAIAERSAETGRAGVKTPKIIAAAEKGGSEGSEEGEMEAVLSAPRPPSSFSSSSSPPPPSPPPPSALPTTDPVESPPARPPTLYTLSPSPPLPMHENTEALSPLASLHEQEGSGTSSPPTSRRHWYHEMEEEGEDAEASRRAASSSPLSGGAPYSPVVVPVIERVSDDRRARCCSCHFLLFSRSFSCAVTEALGTFFLVFSVPLSAAVVGELAPFAVGFMLLSMILAMGYLSGGHFNPAISFAVWLCSPEATASGATSVVVHEGVGGGESSESGRWGSGAAVNADALQSPSSSSSSSPPTFPFSKLVVYVVAQLIGGFLASVYAFIVSGGGSMSIPLYTSETGEWKDFYLVIRVILTEAMYTFLMCSVPLHIGGSALLSSILPEWEKDGENEKEEEDGEDEEEEEENETGHVDVEIVDVEEGSSGRREREEEEEEVVVARGGGRRSSLSHRSLSTLLPPLHGTNVFHAKKKKKMRSMTSYDRIKASFQPHHLCGFGVAFALMAGQFAGGTISAGVFNPAVYTSLSVTRCVLTFTADNCGKPIFALWIYWLGELLGSVVASMAYVGLLHLRKTSREEDNEARRKKLERRTVKKWRKKKAKEEEARRGRQRRGERQWAEDSLRELFGDEDSSKNRGKDKRRA